MSTTPSGVGLHHKEDGMSTGPTSNRTFPNPAVVSNEAAQAYEQVLSAARASKSSDPIPNRYPWHCRIAVGELMKFATQLQCGKPANPVVVRVLTGTLARKVYEPGFLNSLGDFLGAGGHVRILIWNTVDSVRESYGGSSPLFAFSTAPGFEVKVTGTREFGEKVTHFLTVDKTAFRLEVPHRYFDSGTFNDFEPDVPARICFNDTKTTGTLVDFFENLWKAIPGQATFISDTAP